MIKIYGSMLCKDCVQCCADLDSRGVPYEYLDIADSLDVLKYFLAVRDREEMFVPVKEEGRIGIPLILLEDGSYTFDWQQIGK